MHQHAQTPTQRRHHAGTLIVAGFGGFIGLGALLLALPVSHRSGEVVTLGDALFTASSAVTVTGLVVTDTRTVWSPFGESVLIALMQVGGLGIMTLAAFLAVTFNRRLGLRRGLVAGEEIGVVGPVVMKDLIVRIGRFVLVSELVATALLTIGFISDGDHSVVRSLHLAVFHAVSAFNNAGFSILDGGLERYVENWYMNLVVAGTFILGGLGFPVVFELRRAWRQPRRWTLHTKVTMTTTAVLLVGGTLLVAASEWQGSALDGLGTADRMLASFFQSATARTAGFNTLPIADLEPSTWLVLILLMVIGAGSASTGGGIKVTTWAVVVRSTMSEFRRDKATTMFSRSIPLELQRKSLALVTAALATVGTTTFLLTATHENIPIAELLFEAASAFGTVGVSTGVTDQLSTFGRLLIIALMFIGRVGPITFGTAVLLRRQRPLYSYADESLIVG